MSSAAVIVAVSGALCIYCGLHADSVAFSNKIKQFEITRSSIKGSISPRLVTPIWIACKKKKDLA
jgi:hypothetical protein